MNILFVSPSSSMKNGASRCYVDIVKYLIKNDNVISVILADGEVKAEVKKNVSKCFVIGECDWCWVIGKTDKIKGFKYIKLFLRKLQNLFQSLRYVGIILIYNVDVVYLNTSTAYVAAIAAKITRKPLVWHIREFIDEDLKLEFTDKEYTIKLLEYAKKQICISKSIQNKFISKYRLSKTQVVYDGVVVDKFYCNRKVFNGDKIKISIFGRIFETKGQLLFLMAINILKQEYNLECQIVGSDDNDITYTDRVKNYIKDNDLCSIVHLTGYVCNPENYMKETDIVCVCSESEGFGLVTIEAMLAGALLVGSNSGCTTELIEDLKTGFLYEKNNYMDLYKKLKFAIENKDLVQKITKTGQEYALQFSVENNVRKVSKILNEAVNIL